MTKPYWHFDVVQPVTSPGELESKILGQRNVDIARHLFISTDTVRTHLEQIHRKMGVSSRLAAIVEAHELQRA